MRDSFILELAFSITKRIIPITLQLQYQKGKAWWHRNICYLIPVKTTYIANWYFGKGQGFCLHYHSKNCLWYVFLCLRAAEPLFSIESLSLWACELICDHVTLVGRECQVISSSLSSSMTICDLFSCKEEALERQMLSVSVCLSDPKTEFHLSSFYCQLLTYLN